MAALRYIPICFLLVMLLPSSGRAWGFYSHPLIARKAVRTLPPEMQAFFLKNIDILEAHSLDPDRRKHCVPDERCKHYIDLEYYGDRDSIPRYWYKAVQRYSEDSLKEWGTVPYTIQLYYYLLVEAFIAEDAEQILDIAGELSHYLSDAHVPLHATANYDGQLTGQHGLHSFWETAIPELEAVHYDLGGMKARFIPSVPALAWEVVHGSYAAMDTVLAAEWRLRDTFPVEGRYCEGRRNGRITCEYTPAYISAYSRAMGGMVEERMRASIVNTGSLWMTAWIEAGQPDLSRLPAVQLRTEEPESEQEE